MYRKKEWLKREYIKEQRTMANIANDYFEVCNSCHRLYDETKGIYGEGVKYYG